MTEHLRDKKLRERYTEVPDPYYGGRQGFDVVMACGHHDCKQDGGVLNIVVLFGVSDCMVSCLSSWSLFA